MNELTQEFCLQYTLRRGQIREIAQRYRDAFDEDLTCNADMFDITRTTFSQSKHPNRVMRELEKDLREGDAPLLCMLCAMLELGMEQAQGLADLSPGEFASEAALLCHRLRQQAPPAGLLAQRLTEIKSQHAQKRLSIAMHMMDTCLNTEQ